jgi:hypothetical protein
MLDQVVVSRTMRLRVVGQCPYSIQLVVAREGWACFVLKL